MLPYAADNYAAAIDKRGIEHKNQLSSRLFVTGDNFEVGCGKVYLFRSYSQRKEKHWNL